MTDINLDHRPTWELKQKLLTDEMRGWFPRRNPKGLR